MAADLVATTCLIMFTRPRRINVIYVSPEEDEKDGQWDGCVCRDGQEEKEHVGYKSATRLTPVRRHLGGVLARTGTSREVLKPGLCSRFVNKCMSTLLNANVLVYSDTNVDANGIFQKKFLYYICVVFGVSNEQNKSLIYYCIYMY